MTLLAPFLASLLSISPAIPMPSLGSQPASLTEIRARAAEFLAAELPSLEEAEVLDSGEVRRVIERACALLDGSRLAQRLTPREGLTAKQWVITLRSVYDAATFQVVREAELPVGFPEPTLVGEVEIKRYPGYRMARASMGPGGMVGENLAFWALFQHIQSNEISMTAPVEMAYGDSEKGASMAFLYGAPEIGEAGGDGRVEVIDIPPQAMVSLGLRGSRAAKRIEAARATLEEWIRANPEYVADGPLRVFGYNSPSVRGNRQYFEVQIPVSRVVRVEWL
ncbi:MAG: heme-binding protein [Planctomycetota bacterium]